MSRPSLWLWERAHCMFFCSISHRLCPLSQLYRPDLSSSQVQQNVHICLHVIRISPFKPGVYLLYNGRVYLILLCWDKNYNNQGPNSLFHSHPGMITSTVTFKSKWQRKCTAEWPEWAFMLSSPFFGERRLQVEVSTVTAEAAADSHNVPSPVTLGD